MDDRVGTDDYPVSAPMNQYLANRKAARKGGTSGVFEVVARGFTEKFGGVMRSDTRALLRMRAGA